MREALKRLHSMLPTTETHLVAEALAEVEAIEKAAKTLTSSVEITPADEDAVRLLERIAKDAP